MQLLGFWSLMTQHQISGTMRCCVDAVLYLELADYMPEFTVVVCHHNQALVVEETIGDLLRQIKGGLWHF